MWSWLPGKREEQLAMAKEWLSVLNSFSGSMESPTNASKWGVPHAEVTELKGLVINAEGALAVTKNTEVRSHVANIFCGEVFNVLVAKMHFIKTRYFKKPPLAVHNLTALGLYAMSEE